MWEGRFGSKWSPPTVVTSGQRGHGPFGAARTLRLGWSHEPPLSPPGHPGCTGGPDPHRRAHRRAEGLTVAAEPLLRALTRMRGLLLDDQTLVRAVASGRRKGQTPPWRRVELRYVDLKAGRRLQVTAYDDTQAHTSNHAPGDDARASVDGLLDLPFGNWHVETTTETH